MPKRKPCPVEGCPRSWQTTDGLGKHLYSDHLKSELITVIFQQMKTIEDLNEKLRLQAWSKRRHV